MSVRLRWRSWLAGSSKTQRAARRALYYGRSVECPCCGRSARRYMASYNRRDALCSCCFSEERQRALRLYLGDLFSELPRPLTVLHFSPESPLRNWLQALPDVDYVPVDISTRPDVSARLDMTALGLGDGSVDLVIASHVLEHVPDDFSAVRELSRVLRSDGRALIMVPLDASRQQTYEDPAITTPEARAVAYWQFDHVRLYGRDFPSRLESCGVRVTLVRPSEHLDAKAVGRFGLACDPAAVALHPVAPPDEIYVVTPGAHNASAHVQEKHAHA